MAGDLAARRAWIGCAWPNTGLAAEIWACVAFCLALFNSRGSRVSMSEGNSRPSGSEKGKMEVVKVVPFRQGEDAGNRCFDGMMMVVDTGQEKKQRKKAEARGTLEERELNSEKMPRPFSPPLPILCCCLVALLACWLHSRRHTSSQWSHQPGAASLSQY